MFKRILRSKTLQARARWVLAIILVPPFLFFFHLWTGGRAASGPEGVAGELFGRPVSREVFEQDYQLTRRLLEAQLGDIPLEFFEPILRQQTWDRLILREEARRRIRISDEVLVQHLRSLSLFQQDGRFVPELYHRYVRAVGSSERVFEERLRDDLRFQRFLDSLKAQVALSDEEVREAYAKEFERINAALLVVEPASLLSQIAPLLTEQALRDDYAAHQEAVRLPAQRTIDYLGMSFAEALEQRGSVSDEAIQAYYEEHREEFVREDGTTPPLADLTETIRQRLHEEAARKRLQDVALDLEEDLEAGLSFETIAAARHLAVRTVGPLEESAAEDLNKLPASALRAVFEVSVGQMTSVIRDPSGVFLLRPIEEIPSYIPPFEEVRAQIERVAREATAREAAQARARQLHDELHALLATDRSFDQACALLGAVPRRPEPFTRRGPIEGVGDVPAVASSLAALTPGELADVLEIPQGFVIGMVEERLPYDEAQFAKDNEDFRKTLLESKQQTHLAATLDSLRAKARLKSYLDRTSQ